MSAKKLQPRASFGLESPEKVVSADSEHDFRDYDGSHSGKDRTDDGKRHLLFDSSTSFEESGDDQSKNAIAFAETHKKTNSVAIIVAGTILGNVLEWYDFSVYSAFAVEIGQNFFPSGGTGAEGGEGGGQCGQGGDGNSLLATLAVFGAAFVARPIGGVLMGHIGDKMGRTLALQLSVILQGVAAMAISVLPSNQCPGCGYQIGLTASILLVLVRLLQGISVGGELVGSMIYSAETAPEGRKAMLACVPLSSAYIGTAIGYLVAGILHLALSESQILIWGWRLGFALGTPLAILAMFMRRWLHESDDFTNEKEKMKDKAKENAVPLVRVIQSQKTAIFLVLLAVCLWAMGNWLASSWLRIFYTELIENKVSPSFGAILNFCVILSGGLLFYPVSAVADKLEDGLFIVMTGSCIFVFILSLPLMYIIQLGSTCLFGVIVGHFCINFGVVLFGAPMTAWMTQKFPIALRYSALAIAYNTSQMLFGGIAPFLATAITCNSKYKILGGLLFLMAATITCMGVLVSDKTFFGRRAFAEAIKEQNQSGSYEDIFTRRRNSSDSSQTLLDRESDHQKV